MSCFSPRPPIMCSHYNTCPSDLAAGTNATVFFDADTQYIAFVNGAVELGELWAEKVTSFADADDKTLATPD